MIFHLSLSVFGPAQTLAAFEETTSPSAHLRDASRACHSDPAPFFIADPSLRLPGQLVYSFDCKGFPESEISALAKAFPGLEFWLIYRSCDVSGWLRAQNRSLAWCSLNQTNLEARELNTCAPQCFLPNALLQEVAETTKSLQTDLSTPLLYLQRARALARLGRQEEAIRDLTGAIDHPAMREESVLAELFARRADAYLSVGQQQQAKEDYAAAADIYFSLNQFEQWQTCRDRAE